jgi:hypothetical protein
MFWHTPSHKNSLPKEQVLCYIRKCRHYLHTNPSINVTYDQLICVMVKCSVFFAVRTELLNII